ncbi:MAG TPA: sugar porter family MFS transporter [Candidatus Tumulicola sp.]|jgi:sugar porter (SP) family MFS transporter
MRPYVLLVASVAALGGLLFGYDTGVISGAILFIGKDFSLSTHLQEFTISVVLIGCILGAAVTGTVADRIGRRLTLLTAGIVFLAGALVSALAPDETVLLIGRFVVGIGVGFSSVVSPLYISEVAPANVRGALVSLYQFAITVGILGAYLIDFRFSSAGDWRTMLGFAVVPSVILIAGMIVMPESPRYLFKIGHDSRARDVLQRIAETPDESASEERAILAALHAKTAGFAVFKDPSVRIALFIGVTLAVLQQVTGINTIIYYGPKIFEMAGISSASTSILAESVVGTVNVLMTLIAIFFVDRVGRKPLLYLGLTGMFIALASLAIAFAQPHLSGSLAAIALGSMMLYVGCFAFSLGPIVWLLISEIFPLPARGLGMSISTLANWVGNFLVSQFFLTMLLRLGAPATFWVYAVLCVVTILFVRSMVPETKRELLEQISVGTRAGATGR